MSQFAPIRCTASLLALLSVLAVSLRAQVSTADIVGTITDATDAVVVGAKVTATNLATGLDYGTVSNSRGDFAIPLLPAGRYRIRIEATGFKAWTFAETALAVGGTPPEQCRSRGPHKRKCR